MYFNVSNSLTLSNSYEFLLSHVPSEKQKAIEEKIAKIKDQTIYSIGTLVEAFALEKKNIPYIILAAFKQGKISDEEYRTLQLFAETLQFFGPDNVKLVDLESDQAEAILRYGDESATSPSSSRIAKEKLRHPSHLNDNWASFLQEVKKLKNCEKWILTAPMEKMPIEKDQPLSIKYVTNTLSNEFGHYVDKLGNLRQVIPSLGAAQSLNDTFERPLKLVYLHGDVSDEEVEKMVEKGIHPVQGDLPDAPHPIIADGATAEGPAFACHDIFHGLSLTIDKSNKARMEPLVNLDLNKAEDLETWAKNLDSILGVSRDDSKITFDNSSPYGF